MNYRRLTSHANLGVAGGDHTQSAARALRVLLRPDPHPLA